MFTRFVILWNFFVKWFIHIIDKNMLVDDNEEEETQPSAGDNKERDDSEGDRTDGNGQNRDE